MRVNDASGKRALGADMFFEDIDPLVVTLKSQDFHVEAYFTGSCHRYYVPPLRCRLKSIVGGSGSRQHLIDTLRVDRSSFFCELEEAVRRSAQSASSVNTKSSPDCQWLRPG